MAHASNQLQVRQQFLQQSEHRVVFPHHNTGSIRGDSHHVVDVEAIGFQEGKYRVCDGPGICGTQLNQPQVSADEFSVFDRAVLNTYTQQLDHRYIGSFI